MYTSPLNVRFSSGAGGNAGGGRDGASNAGAAARYSARLRDAVSVERNPADMMSTNPAFGRGGSMDVEAGAEQPSPEPPVLAAAPSPKAGAGAGAGAMRSSLRATPRGAARGNATSANPVVDVDPARVEVFRLKESVDE